MSTSPQPPAIEIRGLTKSYGDTVALRGVDLTLQEGQFYGLLGPNGAGKSTTINILTGLVRREGGTSTVFGRDTEKDFRFTRAQIGIAAQELSVDWFFPLERLLRFQAGYYGIPYAQARPRIEMLLKKLGLWGKRTEKLRNLSGGMKRRFQLAKALVHDPKIIILDEPTAGVDVELRRELWDYLRELHSEGKTILLTTHYIEEAELLCETVSIIDNGKVIKKGTPRDLIRNLGTAGMTVHLNGWDDNLNELLKEYTFTREEYRLHFSIQHPEEAMPRIITILARHGCTIQSVKTNQSTLEDVFISLTGKGINE
ncbi:MAG: ABC transporter ATP-binding protein [FCB group bacterium]|nr:ABC transporter ATP-binding protein [FCB group bacterium]